MPDLRQLVFVRDHAAHGREECQRRFARQWPDPADFERCWAAAAKDAARERAAVLVPAKRRMQVIGGVALLLGAGIGVTALVVGGLPRGTGPLLLLAGALWLWSAWRYYGVRRELDEAFPMAEGG
jgi:hypothetical protein